MCHQNCCVHLSVEEAITADESLLIYCKPVELYNILHRRAQYNPSFLRRCLRYKMKGKRKRRLAAGIVIFNYRDYNNKLQKTEVTEDYACPFCSMMCMSFKGLRYHLCSSHDLFNFEFWASEEYKAVNVSVKIDRFVSETVADGIEQRHQTFFFCSRPRKRKSRNLDRNERQVCVQFLELDSPKLPMEGISEGTLRKDDGENASKSSSSERDLHNLRHEAENYGVEYPGATELMEHVASSSNIPGISFAKAQYSVDSECIKSQAGIDPSLPAGIHVAKARKLTVERSDPRNCALLQKRQFYHSHRVQPMAIEQVMSDRDSEDEVDDDIADFEDRRMLDDFVDVSKDEKQLMHLWNSFVRKQRVLADGHVPWACEAFSKFHGQELIGSPALFWSMKSFMDQSNHKLPCIKQLTTLHTWQSVINLVIKSSHGFGLGKNFSMLLRLLQHSEIFSLTWSRQEFLDAALTTAAVKAASGACSPIIMCWRLFMIKLWNHGLLDASSMNNCNIILERCRDEGSDATKTERADD